MWNISKVNELSPAIVSKGIRIIPQDYQSGRRRHICLRVEVYGCKIPSDTGPYEIVHKNIVNIRFK